VSETRKLAAILVSDIVGYSRLAGSDEDRILARLRTLRSDLFDPTIAVHHGRIVKRTGDGSIIEFRSVVDAVRCAIEVQNGLIESAMRACLRTGGSNSVSASMSATSSRKATAT
jgi:adenylate cyclase